MKRAFPAAAKNLHERKVRSGKLDQASMSPEEALKEFDRVVEMAAAGATRDAERVLEAKDAADLLLIAKEVGIAIPKSKVSTSRLREAVFGKVRESVLLTRHTARPESAIP